MENQIATEAFTADDFKNGNVYDYIVKVQQKYGDSEMLKARASLTTKAKEFGITKADFREGLKVYMKELQNSFSNMTEFTDAPLTLKCGNWECTDNGVYGYDRMGFKVQVCSHPIMPVKRMKNIETGQIKTQLAYKRGGKWSYLTVDKKTISSNSAILELADTEIAVTSENAKALVSYLSDLESLNYETLVETKSTTRMGWIDDGLFAPYSENVEFDGDDSFSSIYESIKSHGNYGKWKDLCLKIRNKGDNGIYAKIVLASAFASVIIKDCKLLPFFVHLWGGTESGKTVSIMLAASVWGNPEIGKYPQTFNSTFVAQEMLASFLNNMPLIMDELQIIKDRTSFDEMIYKLTEGAGKSRGKKDGGIKRTTTWRNCVLTTGEYPIVNSRSGSGAVNRIIEIDCKSISFFDNPNRVVDIITENYGFAGKEFISYLLDEENMEKVKKLQKQYYKELEKYNNMSKQAAAASAILAADEMVTELIFKDGNNLTVKDLAPMLVSRFKASQNERAYEYLCDCIDINRNRFEKNSFGEWSGEIWGVVEDDITYIIKTKFDQMLESNGYNAKAFISWGVMAGKIKSKNPNTPTVVHRVANNPCRCIAVVRDGEYREPPAPIKPDKNDRVVENISDLPTDESTEKEDIFADFDFVDDYDII